MKKNIKIALILLTVLMISGTTAAASGAFHYRIAFYQDWMGFKSNSDPFYSRISSRLKLTAIDNPGDGWTLFFDLRNRITMNESGGAQFIIYDSRISYDSKKSPFFFSLGQMNLYDMAGIGQLTGLLAGMKIGKYFSIGGYGGIEPDIYNTKWQTNYTKFGLFSKFTGTRARQFNLSFNRIMYDGNLEREFIYSSALFPVKDILSVYGSAEYELGPTIDPADRLTRIFSNMRLNLGKLADITGYISIGRGLDFHEFLLNQSKDPSLSNSEIERFYYSSMYGIRLRIKPSKSMNFYIERRESEMRDLNVLNHSYRVGLSIADILRTGFYFYGNYTSNSGDSSESDSFYISLSKSFNRISWGINFSNFFNGIRYTDYNSPQIIHVPDSLTIGTDLFLNINKHLGVTMEYQLSYQKDYLDNQFYLRVIYRGRK